MGQPESGHNSNDVEPLGSILSSRASSIPSMSEKLKDDSVTEIPEQSEAGELWCARCGKYGGHKTADHGQNGGARAGAGRKPGGVNQTTQERLARKQAMIDRIHRAADNLLNAQLNKALGETYLMRKVEEKDSKGKITKVYHEIVTDPDTIIEFLDGGEAGTIDSDPDNYYYMTTKSPDNLALKDLLDRGFGKPDAKLDVTSDGEKIERGMSLEDIDAILARADAEAARQKSES
jgi:hypothetical protein